MHIKIFIASILIALILSAISFFASIYNLFPEPLAVFAVALVGGCLTSYWVCSADGMAASEPSSRAKSRKKTKRTKSVKVSSMETGSVKWFSPSKGFGFITRESGEDIFVHFRSIEGDGHRILRENQKVTFAVTEGDKGLQAEKVSALK